MVLVLWIDSETHLAVKSEQIKLTDFPSLLEAMNDRGPANYVYYTGVGDSVLVDASGGQHAISRQNWESKAPVAVKLYCLFAITIAWNAGPTEIHSIRYTSTTFSKVSARCRHIPDGYEFVSASIGGTELNPTNLSALVSARETVRIVVQCRAQPRAEEPESALDRELRWRQRAYSDF